MGFFGGVKQAAGRVDNHVSRANATASRGVDVAHTQAAAANATASRGVDVAHAQAAAANATASRGVDVAHAQAAAANATASRGVDVAHAQAAAANATASRGVDVANAQAAAANATASRGVDVANAQAAAANATASRGVDVANAQAAAANETASRGVDVANAQAAAANATASRGVDVANAQAAAANETASRGVDMVNAQATSAINMANAQAVAANETVRDSVGVVNDTLDEHLNNLTPAAETLMSDISAQIAQLSNPLLVIATLVGPLQVLTGANIILTMLQTLNIIRGVQGRLLETANDIKVELGHLTDAVKGVRDVLHAGNVVGIVRNITGDKFPNDHKPAILEKGGTKIVQCFAFYSSAEACISQLKGSKFWAYSSINELFSLIYEFSTLSKISSVTATGIKFHLNVYFLDPQPEHPITIPHFHFAGESIEFINHSLNKEAIVFQRLFVAEDSELILKGVQVNNLVSLGRTKLVNCIVRHNPKESIPAPTLEQPAILPIPREKVYYSVEGNVRISYDQCLFSQKKQKSIRSKAGSMFKLKQKKGTVTNFCREVCVVTTGDDAAAEVNPGGQVIFLRKYKECSGSWIKFTVQEPSQHESSLSAMHLFSEGDGLKDLLFLYHDRSEEIIKKQLKSSSKTTTKAVEAVHRYAQHEEMEVADDVLEKNMKYFQRGVDPPADFELDISGANEEAIKCT